MLSVLLKTGLTVRLFRFVSAQMLLEKLGRDLVTQTPAVEKVNVISSALTAAGQLRWRNTGQSSQHAYTTKEKHTPFERRYKSRQSVPIYCRISPEDTRVFERRNRVVGTMPCICIS